MTTADKIKQLRLDKGLSQEALGNLVGVQKAAINKYETGRVVNIKRSTLKLLADALGVTPADLLDDEIATSSPADNTDGLFIEKYGQEVYDAAMTFGRLDAVDQAKVTERMDMLLEDDKYKVAGSYGEKVI